jgi:hypothetical protein
MSAYAAKPGAHNPPQFQGILLPDLLPTTISLSRLLIISKTLTPDNKHDGDPRAANDILLEIILLLRPCAFEKLALSCKQLYDAIFKWLMPRHLEFRKKYNNFKFGPETVRTVPELLKEIAENPSIPSYIIYADLSARQYPDPGDGPYHYPDGVPGALVKLVKKSQHLAALNDDPEFYTYWLKGIVGEYSDWRRPFDFQTAFLLTFLTDVESLILPPQWKDYVVMGHETDEDVGKHRVSDLIQQLSLNANDPSLENQPLQRLRVLHPTPDANTQDGEYMEAIIPFLALDSLREVYYNYGVYEPRGDDYYEAFSLRYPVLGRNVEVLTLGDSVMSDDGADKLFKDMHRLRRFDFEYNLKDELGYDWQAGTFVRNLKRHVGRHLEHLSICTELCMDESEPITFSLRGFKKLTHLLLPTELFIRSVGQEEDDENGSHQGEKDEEQSTDGEREEEYDYRKSEDNGEDDGDENRGSENGESEDGDDQYSEINDDGQHQDADDGEISDKSDESIDEGEVWRLVDNLPSSLDTLEIIARATSRDCKCLERLFDGFEDRKDECLPLLKSVKVNMMQSAWERDWEPEFQEHFDRVAKFFNTIPSVSFHTHRN